jgi:hypothetical protein
LHSRNEADKAGPGRRKKAEKISAEKFGGKEKPGDVCTPKTDETAAGPEGEGSGKKFPRKNLEGKEKQAMFATRSGRERGEARKGHEAEAKGRGGSSLK